MTQEELKCLIQYDKKDGSIRLKEKTTNRQAIGEYVHYKYYISLYGKAYSTLKLLALYLYGDYEIKIITLDGTDNYSYSNLFCVGSLNDVELTQESIKKFLSYDKTSGVFTWIARYSPAIPLGDSAGYVDGVLPNAGYIGLSIFGRRYKAHRIAWLYEFGVFPEYQIDHIDHDRTNNSITNLRLATQHTNMKNKSLYVTNTTGYPGVARYESRWTSTASIRGNKLSLGTFRTFEEAVAAKKASEKILGYHENHGL